MKFLYVAPRYHPNQHPIIEGLVQKGHQVMFCVYRVGPTEKHGGATIKIFSPSGFSRIVKKIQLRKGENYTETQQVFWFQPKQDEVRQCLQDYAPDVVVLRERNLFSLSFVHECRKQKIAKVLMYNQNPIYSKPGSLLVELARKLWFSLFPRKRITVSRYSEYPFTKEGLIEDTNAYFMPHVPRQEPPKERTYLENGVVNIFDCGKYRASKNHKLLVDAVAILRDKGYENFKVTILGQADNEEEKQYYAELTEKVNALGLQEKVELKTKVPYDEIPGHYLKNDVLVLASKSELATVTILDSLSYGLATISTSKNGTADYIEIGKTGFVFKTNDAQDLSEKLEHYLKNPELAQIHGRRAMEEVTGKYRFDAYYQKFMKIIEEL